MKKYVRNRLTASQTIDNETAVLYPKFEKCFHLNATATFLWSMLERPVTMEEMVTAMMKEYDGSKSVVTKDIAGILRLLVKWSLIEKV